MVILGGVVSISDQVGDTSTDRVGVLRALAAELARTLDDPDTPPSAKAALSKELRQVVSDLEAQVVPQEVSTLDALAARRDARLAAAADQSSAAPRSQSRRRGGGTRTS